VGWKNLPATGAGVPTGSFRRRAAGSGAVIDAVGVVVKMEHVADTPPETREAPLVARAPQQDQRNAEDDEPDHIV
jgi:hypothetical protein